MAVQAYIGSTPRVSLSKDTTIWYNFKVKHTTDAIYRNGKGFNFRIIGDSTHPKSLSAKFKMTIFIFEAKR